MQNMKTAGTWGKIKRSLNTLSFRGFFFFDTQVERSSGELTTWVCKCGDKPTCSTSHLSRGYTKLAYIVMWAEKWAKSYGVCLGKISQRKSGGITVFSWYTSEFIYLFNKHLLQSLAIFRTTHWNFQRVMDQNWYKRFFYLIRIR